MIFYSFRSSTAERSDLIFLLLFDIVQAQQQLFVTNLLLISVYIKLSFKHFCSELKLESSPHINHVFS